MFIFATSTFAPKHFYNFLLSLRWKFIVAGCCCCWRQQIFNRLQEEFQEKSLMVLVISVQLCNERKERNEIHKQVFVCSMSLTNLAVVDGVEEDHRSNCDLQEWCNASTLWLHILVLPSPESTTEGSNNGTWSVAAASEPSSYFANLGLAERSVS